MMFLPASLSLTLLLAATTALAVPATDAPFFDPSLPVHGTPVEVAKGQVVPRGLLIRVGSAEFVIFDQELLRPALWLQGEPGKDPLTLETMAQRSWHEPTRKAGAKQPIPTGESRLLAPALPGVGSRVEDLLRDPRPELREEAGRGSLADTGRKLTGYTLAGETGVLTYLLGKMTIEEWYQASTGGLERHLRLPAGETVYFLLGKGRLEGKGAALSEGGVEIAPLPAGAFLEEHEGQLVTRVPASRVERRLVVEYRFAKKVSAPAIAQKPGAPLARWASILPGSVQEAERKGSGWVLDQIALPEENPWKRRVRPADIVFRNEREAFIVTFDGDVWSMTLRGKQVAWRRFAGGLSEALAIELVEGVPQVFTRNGLIRLHDRNGDGEADFYQIHSDRLFQTESTRGYPLDMEVDATGRTWCSFGGISMKGKALGSDVPTSPHAGAIVEISPDGNEVKIVASHAREPFFARDPVAGRIAMSDQQGNYVPASGFFPVMQGAAFGYGSEAQKPVLPSVWLPHEADTSSASPLWVRGTAFKEWEGGLLNLSYGTGRLFLVRPSGAWPSPRGAATSLEIETGVPLLHARVHPGDGSIWLTGFRVYDSRVPALQGLARLRPGPESLAGPVNASVVADGVVLRFAAALAPASVTPEVVRVRSWQYRRTKAYGSPRVKQDGAVGIDGLPSGETILSKDGRSVFIHLPGLPETMQLEVEYEFRLADGTPAKGPAYFTARELEPMRWVEMGFAVHAPDAARAVIRIPTGFQGPATAVAGKEIATRMGCVACHSTDGKTEGHSGPSWKGLFGAMRTMADGKRLTADEAYLKEAIFEPAARVVQGYPAAMGSYSGVLSDPELESVLLYIRSLK